MAKNQLDLVSLILIFFRFFFQSSSLTKVSVSPNVVTKIRPQLKDAQETSKRNAIDKQHY